MQKLEDAKDFASRKKGAIGGAGGKLDKNKSESKTGYSLVAMLTVALISLIVGALATKQMQQRITRTFKDDPIKTPAVETIPE